MRKARPDAKLKHLSPALQGELYEFLKEHSYVKGVEWLAERQIETHATSVRDFWHWYPLSRDLGEVAALAGALREVLREQPEVKLESQAISDASLAVFEARALQKDDVDRFIKLRRLRQHDVRAAQHDRRLEQQHVKVELIRHRYQRETCDLFADWYEQEETRSIMENRPSNEEIIEQMGQRMFGDLWRKAGLDPATLRAEDEEEERQRRAAQAALAEQEEAPAGSGEHS